MDTLYLLRSIDAPNIHRIGRSNNFDKRKKQHQVGEKMVVVREYPCLNAYEAERQLLKIFKQYLLPGQGYMVNVDEHLLIQKIEEVLGATIETRSIEPKLTGNPKSKPPKQRGAWKQTKDGKKWYRNYRNSDGSYRRVTKSNSEFEKMYATNHKPAAPRGTNSTDWTPVYIAAGFLTLMLIIAIQS